MVINETGGPDALSWEARDLGIPGPGEALIRHTAVGVNFTDVHRRRGDHHFPTPVPCGLGLEAAGIVAALGDGCARGSTPVECPLSCGTCDAARPKRFALVVFICNGGVDHYGNPPTEQLVRALRLKRSLLRLRSRLATVAVVPGGTIGCGPCP